MNRTVRKILESSQLAPGNCEDTNTRRQSEHRNLQQTRESGLAGDPGQKGGNSLRELQESLGIADPGFILKLVSQTGNATPIARPDEPVDWNYVATALRGIGSKGELEGLLAAQIVATHSLGMEFLRRSVRHEQSNAGIDLNIRFHIPFVDILRSRNGLIYRRRGLHIKLVGLRKLCFCSSYSPT